MPWARRALGVALGMLVWAWLRTLRMTVITHAGLGHVGERPWALALWHGQQLALLGHRRRRSTVALVSRSSDGDLLAKVLERVGDLTVARGSSSRGGASGLLAIVRCLRRGQDAAFAVDGPRGPRRRARSDSLGCVWAATLSRGVVVPYAAAFARGWVLDRAWDGFEIPLPFTRVAVVLGRPLEPDGSDATVLERAIDDATEEARACVARARR